MFEKPTAADITTAKKLTKAANATRDSLPIPSYTTNKGASAIGEVLSLLEKGLGCTLA